jgi:hypothetical protein
MLNLAINCSLGKIILEGELDCAAEVIKTHGYW